MKSLFLFCILLATLSSSACDCEYGGSFMKVSRQMPAIVLVKVIAHSDSLGKYSKIPLAMEVEVMEVFRGDEKRKRITIGGDDGHLCRPYVTQFKVGGLYIMALYQINPVPGQKEGAAYAISICGAYWLDVEKDTGRVHGDISGTGGNSASMSLDRFRSEFQKQDK
jgi:hypothetical protein